MNVRMDLLKYTLKIKKICSAPKCQFSPAGQSMIQPFLEPFEYKMGGGGVTPIHYLYGYELPNGVVILKLLI